MKREVNFTARGEMLDVNKTTETVIGAAIEVHRHLGPGLLESAFEEGLCEELSLRKFPFQRQVPLPVTYKNWRLDIGCCVDLLVNNEVGIELKTVESILPIHEAQTLTHMSVGGWQLGLIPNFNVTVLNNGIKRLVHKLKEQSSVLPASLR